jgi:hypothetical protein
MRIIQYEKGRACARFTRSPAGSLSYGSPFGLLSFEVIRIIQDENGVLSVTDISIFNKVGGQYSSAQTSMPYSDDATKKISLVDNTIFAQPNQIYQIRFPAKDIVVRVKNYQTTNFS